MGSSEKSANFQKKKNKLIIHNSQITWLIIFIPLKWCKEHHFEWKHIAHNKNSATRRSYRMATAIWSTHRIQTERGQYKSEFIYSFFCLLHWIQFYFNWLSWNENWAKKKKPPLSSNKTDVHINTSYGYLIEFNHQTSK